MRRRFSIRGRVRPSVRPVLFSKVISTHTRRILCRLSGLVFFFDVISGPFFVSLSTSLCFSFFLFQFSPFIVLLCLLWAIQPLPTLDPGPSSAGVGNWSDHGPSAANSSQLEFHQNFGEDPGFDSRATTSGIWPAWTRRDAANMVPPLDFLAECLFKCQWVSIYSKYDHQHILNVFLPSIYSIK